MAPNDLTVFIVDDDASVRDSLGLLLSVKGYRTAVFSSAEDFLAAWRKEWRGCLLIDIRMSGMDGLTLQSKLADLGCSMPIIIITGHGDVALARQAFKASAIDFLEKPLDDVKLLEVIEEAFLRESSAHHNNQRQEDATQLLRELTPREREVMKLVINGQHNREIASKLGISVRTAEVHKARLMTKLRVNSIADLVRTYMERS